MWHFDRGGLAFTSMKSKFLFFIKRSAQGLGDGGTNGPFICFTVCCCISQASMRGFLNEVEMMMG